MAYSEVRIRNCCLSTIKHFIPRVPTRDSDRVVRKVQETNHEGNLEERVVYMYAIPAKTMLRRLNVDGFTHEALQRDFQANLKLRCQWAEDTDDPTAADELKLLRRASLSAWLRALKAVVTQSQNGASQRIITYLTDWLGSYLDDRREEMLPVETLNWPTAIYEYFLRAVAEVVPEDWEFELDVSDFVEEGDYDDFEDLDSSIAAVEMPKNVFDDAMQDVSVLLLLAAENPPLARLLYANIITAFETYLSDTARRGVLSKRALLRRFLETNAPKGDTFPMAQLLARCESIEDYVTNLFEKISFHNVDTAIKVFGEVLLVKFPTQSVSALKKAVLKRNDIVHRNGRQHVGRTWSPKTKEVQALKDLVTTTVTEIDRQIKENRLDTNHS